MPLAQTVRSVQIALAEGGSVSELFWDYPLLLMLPAVAGRGPIVSRDNDTLRGVDTPSRGPSGAFALLCNPETLVVPLEKSDRNPFGNLFTVGRDPTNDLVIDEGFVSRVHCFFSSTPTGWVAQDAGSVNGIVVAGRRVKDREQAPIAPGESVWIGHQELVFVDQTTLEALLWMVAKQG